MSDQWRVWSSMLPCPSMSGRHGYAAARVTSQEVEAGWQQKGRSLDLDEKVVIRDGQQIFHFFSVHIFFCYYLVVYLFEHIILLISIKWKSHNYSPVSNKALPGTEETSLSSANSSSSVGGWCVRGQLETAAVSCSSNRIQTWIRPVTDRDIKVRKQRPGHTHTPCLYLYRHQTPAGHSPSHPHCWLSVPVISLANWQAAPPGRPVWMTSCISLQEAVIKSNIPQVIENPLFQIARLIEIEIYIYIFF